MDARNELCERYLPGPHAVGELECGLNCTNRSGRCRVTSRRGRDSARRLDSPVFVGPALWQAFGPIDGQRAFPRRVRASRLCRLAAYDHRDGATERRYGLFSQRHHRGKHSQPLTVAQLTGLTFKPTAGVFTQNPRFTYKVSDPSGTGRRRFSNRAGEVATAVTVLRQPWRTLR